MAVRTLQLWLVFAVGLFIGPVSAVSNSSRATLDDTTYDPTEFLSSSSQVSQLPKRNVSLRFLEEPKDVVATPGQNVTLRCIAESTTGNVTISWLYEDDLLPGEDGRWEINEWELRLLNVTGGNKNNGRTNAGRYNCLASNKYGKIRSSTAKVRVAKIDDEVAITGVTSSAYESLSVILQCNVRSTPAADVQWTFNNLPLPKDKRYVPLPNGTLLIRNTKLTDTGIYRCIASNSILGKTKTSRNYHLNVSNSPQNNIFPSLHLLTTTNTRTSIGDTIELMCIAIGWPIPAVQWINNKNVTLNSSSTLVIRNAHPKDTGNYTCAAENSAGRTVQHFYLEVYQKPKFNVTPNSTVSVVPQTIRVDCHAEGSPPPEITWLKNGTLFTPDARISKTLSGLVFRNTMSTDSGIYQCVATNAAGRIWAAVQIEINSSLSPPPPQGVQCRTFADDKICVTWSRPAVGIPVQAYSVYTYDIVNGIEHLSMEEVVLGDTFKLVENLRHSTNYSFYIRTFAGRASDLTEKVLCHTGERGLRRLDIETLNSTAVNLTWNRLSSDLYCNGTRNPYVVEWYPDDDASQLSTAMTLEQPFTVAGLLPGRDYRFRVINVNYTRDDLWIMHSIPDSQPLENTSARMSDELPAPKNLVGNETKSTSVMVTWDGVPKAKYYTVCYVRGEDERMCLETELIKSYSPKLLISNLKPRTEYIVTVRAHDFNNVAGVWSEPLNITTSREVPSPVIDLDYEPLNASTACIYWRPPKNQYGTLKRYLVAYTTDPDHSWENRIEYNVSVSSTREHSCRDSRTGLISTVLTNLSTDNKYLVMVMAANDLGVGKIPTPITVKTYETNNNPGGMLNGTKGVAQNQKLGIILGVILAGLCIVSCITIILLRRRCLKRRARTRARAATTGDFRPAAALYSSQLGAVQVRMEQVRQSDEHEIEHLVPEEHSTHIPPVTPEHLDTKGGSNFPNGCVNGLRKHPKFNGNGLNGALHITENPQYYAFECNGNLAKNKSEPLLKRYEEDSNSNVKPFDVLQVLKFFDCQNEYKDYAKSKSDESCNEAGLNSTQLTFLDDSLSSRRKLSPVVEPNG